MRRVSCLAAVLVMLQASFLAADDRELSNKLQQLVQQKNIPQAIQLYDKALQDSPNSRLVRQNGYRMYLAVSRAGNPQKGLGYLEGFIDFMLTKQANIGAYANIYLSGADRLKKSAAADKKLDEWIAKLGESSSKNKDSILATLFGQKAVRLARGGKKSEAMALVATNLDKAKKALAANADSIPAIQAMASMLQVRVNVETALKSKTVDAARKEFIGFATAQAQKHKGNPRVLNIYVNAKMQQIGTTLYTAPLQAEKHIAELEGFLADSGDSPQTKALQRNLARTLGSYKQRLVSAKKRSALIGKPAFPIGTADWVNGEAVTDDALKGKVVLIDFWAVWCGPCIRTFPHLREWQTKYGDKGLVILGATRYYKNYTFANGRLGRATAPLSAEDEQKMLVDFGKHHKLSHRFAVIAKDNPYQKSYGVTGIPQAVVVDRKGVIRMIRVGSGDQNAHDLHEMIQKCLAEGASE